MPVIALLVAAVAALPAGAQSMLPSGTQPARSLPAKVTTQPRLATVEPRILLRNVTVLRGKTSVEVHIESSGPVKPVAMVLSGPDRIVIDLADVGYGDSRRIPVNAGDVQGVRVALFHADPPVTRVVVDLARPHEYRLLSAGSTVILAIDASAKPAAAAPTIVAKVATVAMPNSAAPAPEATADHPPVPTPAPETKQAPPAAAPEAPAQPPAAPAPTPPAPPPEPTPPSTSAQLSPAEEEETTPHQAAKGRKPGLVRSVTVSRGKDAVEVHIEGSKPLRASASTLSDPERIVIDLSDVRLRHPRRIPVNLADVQAVDIALYLVNPLVTRVVVNLAHAHPYHLQTDGNSLTVRIETNEIKAAGSPPVQ
ncbi:MAG: AMIN domain-containing protein [Terriglobales bacterium]